MLVNIDSYVRSKIYYTKYGELKNRSERAMRKIYDFIHEYKITRDGILTNFASGNIEFKKQIGGEIFNIKLKDNKSYHYDVKQLTSKNNKKHKICFVNIRDDSTNCLCFTYHSKETKLDTLELVDLNAIEDCIYCEDKKNKFKIGDILMQIFLELIRTNKEFTHIKKITLQDNSTKKCYGYGIPLKYLRTITNGTPYYAKYGFRPYNKKNVEIFRENREVFKKNNLLDTKILNNIFEETRNETNIYAYETYKNYLKKDLVKKEKIDIKQLLRDMMDIEKTKLENKYKNGFCELLNMKIIDIYLACGYKSFVGHDDRWVLEIIR
jgi:hypothetical protein